MDISVKSEAGVATVTLRGRLDAAWSGPVLETLQKTVRDGFHHLNLELEGVAYISSAGIRVILAHWKDLRRVQGQLYITTISTEVERILRLAGLGVILDAKTPVAVAPAAGAPKVKEWTGTGFSGDVETSAPDARWQGRLIGQSTAALNLASIATAPLASVKLPRSALALGLGALGTAESGQSPRLGELLAVGGSAVFMPADGENQADYAVTEGELAPEAQLAQGLVAEGGFASVARFEVAGEANATTLSDLTAGMLAASGSPQIAFAAVVECAALVGACLRRAPGTPGAETAFNFPAVRDWLTFTAEPAYQNTTVLLVGVAASAATGPLAGFTRPSSANGAPYLHVHAAAFPFRPVRQGRLALAETVAGLFDAGRISGVLHLLPDLRPERGAGESRFYRGACWFGPLDL